MDLNELHALVRQGESERAEFKKTTGQRSEAARTVCAMLNGVGGLVLFGVTPAGKVIGQAVTPHTLEEVHNELRKIEPALFPAVETLALPDGNAVIVLTVPGDAGGPFTYDGRPYLRNGPTTMVMPRFLYERRLLERLHPDQRWEKLPAVRFTVADLDHGEIARTVEEAVRRNRLEEPGTRDVDKLLLGLDLIQEGRLLNAAVVLFGKAEKLFADYPQCLLRMARFRGLDKSEFLDNRQEVGNAFDLFQKGQRFWISHLPIAGRIVPTQPERIDVPLYPPDALREALVNALCHRDYSIPGDAIDLAIYDDRLEITSPGPLPFGQTPEALFQPHRSRPWNPLIAEAFYRRGLIEQWGRGTLKIADLVAQAGLPPVEINATPTDVTVCFRHGQTKVRPVAADLTPLQRRLLEVLAQTGQASLGEIMSRLEPGTARRTVQRGLHTLRERGLVNSTGKYRHAQWELTGAAH